MEERESAKVKKCAGLVVDKFVLIFLEERSSQFKNILGNTILFEGNNSKCNMLRECMMKNSI